MLGQPSKIIDQQAFEILPQHELISQLPHFTSQQKDEVENYELLNFCTSISSFISKYKGISYIF